MARYYFDTDDQRHLVIDDEGIDLPDHESAQKLAMHGLKDLMCDCVEPPTAGRFTVEVRRDGKAIFSGEIVVRSRWAPGAEPQASSAL